MLIPRSDRKEVWTSLSLVKRVRLQMSGLTVGWRHGFYSSRFRIFTLRRNSRAAVLGRCQLTQKRHQRQAGSSLIPGVQGSNRHSKPHIPLNCSLALLSHLQIEAVKGRRNTCVGVINDLVVIVVVYAFILRIYFGSDNEVRVCN